MNLNMKITKAIDIQIERERFIRYALPSTDLDKCEKLMNKDRLPRSVWSSEAYVEKATSFVRHGVVDISQTPAISDLNHIFVCLLQEYEAVAKQCLTFIPNATINLLTEAMQGIEDEPLTYEDVAENPIGFMYFERPVCTLEPQLVDNTWYFAGDYIRALGWHTHYNRHSKAFSTKIIMYSDYGIRRHIQLPLVEANKHHWEDKDLLENEVKSLVGDSHTPDSILKYEEQLDWLHETSSHLRVVDPETGEVTGHPERTAGARCLFLAVMRLWEQRVFDRYEADHANDGLDRTTRKRSLRSLPDADAPCVLDYRAPGNSGKRLTGTGAQLEHRHLVRGHWKNAWFPSQQKHKRIWIRPYSRGKEDAPFIDRKKASII